MPRTQKIITPKGQRYPGSGRKAGTPNPISIEARQLAHELVNDAHYQARLRRDFEARKLHPTIESLVWAYAIGKPRQDITLDATVNVNARLENERRAFALLDLPELEALAAESQAMVDKAMALANARVNATTPQHLAIEGEVLESGEKIIGKGAGSDNPSSVNHPREDVIEAITPDDSEG